MARRHSGNLRYGFMAVAIALMLWGMAHGASTIERGFDIPVVFQGVPDDVVITDRSTEEINIRVQGSRAALRNISPTKTEYVVRVQGAKPGLAVYDVDESVIEMPRGAKVVSRSPARIEVRFEPRGRKNVRVQLDVEGEPAEGFAVGEITYEPDRVWVVGARREVLRLSDAITEKVDVSGLSKSTEKEVRLSLGEGHVWMQDPRPIKVQIPIEPLPAPEDAAKSGGGAQKAK